MNRTHLLSMFIGQSAGVFVNIISLYSQMTLANDSFYRNSYMAMKMSPTWLAILSTTKWAIS